MPRSLAESAGPAWLPKSTPRCCAAPANLRKPGTPTRKPRIQPDPRQRSHPAAAGGRRGESALLALPELLRQSCARPASPATSSTCSYPASCWARRRSRPPRLRPDPGARRISHAWPTWATRRSPREPAAPVARQAADSLGYVRNVATDARRAAIARAVIALAHTLGMQVLANGLASTDELQFFKWEDCDHGQGDMLGHGVGDDEVDEGGRAQVGWHGGVLPDIWPQLLLRRCRRTHQALSATKRHLSNRISL
ncbi:EAL domain-containing protein [Cupriavidus basilensis]